MKLIVGLGNPGKEYENTRHNAGFIVLDFILGKKADWKKSSNANAFYYADNIAGKSVEYLKPLTFMNNSGKSVLYAKTKHKIPFKDIVVIYDDIDLPLGKIKISFDKNSGGHNGLESIIQKLKSKEFLRVRIGIAPVSPTGKIKKPKGEEKILKFLLGEFKEDELKIIKKLAKEISDAIEVIYKEGKDKAMSLYN